MNKTEFLEILDSKINLAKREFSIYNIEKSDQEWQKIKKWLIDIYDVFNQINIFFINRDLSNNIVVVCKFNDKINCSKNIDFVLIFKPNEIELDLNGDIKLLTFKAKTFSDLINLIWQYHPDYDKCQDFIDFYLNKKPNCEGLYLKDIWSLSNDELEYNHNYIQWLFPTDQSSKFNLMVPVLPQINILEIDSYYHPFYQEFQNNQELQTNLMKSFEIMIKFYGFDYYEYHNNEYNFHCNDQFEKIKENYLTKNNHNFLRISRILRSLTLLKNEQNHVCTLAMQFFNFLVTEIWVNYHDVIGIESLKYWREAVFGWKN